jgi:hypothetical protein
MSVFTIDPVVKTNLLLKNSWNLASPLDTGSVKFSTYWLMDRPIDHWVVTKCLNPKFRLLTTGGQPLYQHNEALSVSVFVRIESDSGTAQGQGRSDIYRMQKEVERILFSGSRITTGFREEFIQLEAWREMDQDKWLPILYRRELQVDYWVYETGST